MFRNPGSRVVLLGAIIFCGCAVGFWASFRVFPGGKRGVDFGSYRESPDGTSKIFYVDPHRALYSTDAGEFALVEARHTGGPHRFSTGDSIGYTLVKTVKLIGVGDLGGVIVGRSTKGYFAIIEGKYLDFDEQQEVQQACEESSYEVPKMEAPQDLLDAARIRSEKGSL